MHLIFAIHFQNGINYKYDRSSYQYRRRSVNKKQKKQNKTKQEISFSLKLLSLRRACLISSYRTIRVDCIKLQINWLIPKITYLDNSLFRNSPSWNTISFSCLSKFENWKKTKFQLIDGLICNKKGLSVIAHLWI